MKKFISQNKIVVTSLVFFVISFTLVKFLVFPQIKKAEDNRNSIQEKIIDNQIAKNRIEKISETEEIDKKLKSNDQFLEVILGGDSEVSFIQSLESLAEQTGNKIELKISEAPKPDDKNSKKDENKEKDIIDTIAYSNYFMLEINLKGSYSSLVNFMNKIENHNYYLNVLGVNIKKELLEKNNEQSARSTFFSSPLGEVNVEPVGEAKNEEVLSSVINAIVYLKK